MARTFAQVRLDMWADPDVRKLQEREQRLYLLLLTHDLTFAGVADWRPARLAGFAADSTAESIREAAHGLARASFVVIDEGTEEIMLRSFLRHDGLLRQPRVSVSMANAYAATSSATIRGVLVHELLRLSVEYPDWAAWTLPQVQKILGHDPIDPKTLPVPDGPGLEDGLPIGLGSALPIDLPIGLGVPLPSAKGSVKGLPTPAPAPAPSPTPILSDAKTTSSAKDKRGQRLPADFQVTPDMVTWARKNASEVNGALETQKFVDYWTAQPGSKGLKLDWVATWRNWMRTANERSAFRPVAKEQPVPSYWRGSETIG